MGHDYWRMPRAFVLLWMESAGVGTEAPTLEPQHVVRQGLAAGAAWSE